MDIAALTGIGAAQTSPASQQGLGSLDNDAFLQLMIAQMRYQDPMQPSDPSAMMEQTSVMAQTEMLQQVAEVQQQLLGLQQVTIARDLIGTHVEAELDDGTTVAGIVDSVSFGGTTPTLTIDGTDVPLDNATQFHNN